MLVSFVRYLAEPVSFNSSIQVIYIPLCYSTIHQHLNTVFLICVDAAKRQIRQRVRSASSDTNDASTQTKTNEDSGVGSISPKSEHR